MSTALFSHFFVSTTHWNHLNWSSDSSLAVTRSTGYATCKYFFCPKPYGCLHESVLMAKKGKLKLFYLLGIFTFRSAFQYHTFSACFIRSDTCFLNFKQYSARFSTKDVSAGGVKAQAVRLLFTPLSVLILYKSLFPESSSSELLCQDLLPLRDGRGTTLKYSR